MLLRGTKACVLVRINRKHGTRVLVPPTWLCCIIQRYTLFGMVGSISNLSTRLTQSVLTLAIETSHTYAFQNVLDVSEDLEFMLLARRAC